MIVMDVQMPGGDGITATQELRQRLPESRVLILTLFDLDEYVIGGLRAGAAGFILKTAAPASLIQAVRSCAAGQSTVDAAVMARVVGAWLVDGAAPVSGLDELTDRERDVLGCLADGSQRRDRGAAVHRGDDGQDPCGPGAGQARGPRSAAGGDHRPPRRTGWSWQIILEDDAGIVLGSLKPVRMADAAAARSEPR